MFCNRSEGSDDCDYHDDIILDTLDRNGLNTVHNNQSSEQGLVKLSGFSVKPKNSDSVGADRSLRRKSQKLNLSLIMLHGMG